MGDNAIQVAGGSWSSGGRAGHLTIRRLVVQVLSYQRIPGQDIESSDPSGCAIRVRLVFKKKKKTLCS